MKENSLSFLLLRLGAILLASEMLAPAAPVRLSEQDEVIPTYLAGPPDPNPMFYFGRQSQGAEGRIYPYPLYDNLTNEKVGQRYHVVYLENEYVKIGILPEIGGRLFSAVDKTDNYDFVYRQHVIKPALIGLIGAWISGGIEWNIPHHHRASTFLPVQWRTEENPDGSKTVWVGELEVRHRMRWAVGYTLRPGSSVLTCSVRIANRTPVSHTMLCFANVAVNANENYQIIFPPSTQWVTYHGKREFASWPIAHSRYSGADFTAGVDVSWYKNHLNANSMFAWNDSDDFFAGYDHGKNAGTMSIADHHVVPGKKFWTWGSGPRGRMWDDILTDTDGPYIELMVGAYSDNQPDYSWLQPFETRSLEMNWYPFRDIGGVKNANLDAAVNLEVTNGLANFGFYTTAAHKSAAARLAVGDKTISEEQISINPARPYTKQVRLPAGVSEYDVRASLSVAGHELVAYAPLKLVPQPQPEIVTGAPAPKDIPNTEELFLAGQRIDQFHDPQRDGEPYWQEVLRRDPGSTAAHTALGKLDLEYARFDSAEKHFLKALDRLMAKYTTPKDAEPLYYLGLALEAQGKMDRAYDAFFKAAWSQEWKSPAYFSLAEIAVRRGDFSAALDFVDRSLDANALNMRAYGLKSAVLRHLGRNADAKSLLKEAVRKTDPLDARLLTEQWLASGKKQTPDALAATLREFPNAGLEVAAEFGNAGLWQDGTAVLTLMVDVATNKTRVPPLAYYYLGHFAEQLGDAKNAAEFRRLAAQASPEYCFPFQWEAIHVLKRAMEVNPQDARAPYYLGNLLFDWQPEEALVLWEKSAALDPSFPIVHRNLAVGWSYQSETNQARAIAELEKAIALSENYPAHLFELDQLYQTAGTPPEKRLAVLEAHRQAVLRRDEGRARLISLKIFAGENDEAIALMSDHVFNIWEGGTRFNTTELWTDAHLSRGRQRFAAGQFRPALGDFQLATAFPKSLRAETRDGGGARSAEIACWIGNAYEALGESANAQQSWQKALGDESPRGGRRGGGGTNRLASERGVQRFYQAMAQRKLGQTVAAQTVFQQLVAAGMDALKPDGAETDSTASVDRQPRRALTIMAHYVAGLGHLGLGENDEARREFTEVLKLTPDHLGAKSALGQIP